jgi:hypothetical protein
MALFFSDPQASDANRIPNAWKYNKKAEKQGFCLSAYNTNTHTVMAGKLMKQGLGTNPRAAYVGVDSLVLTTTRRPPNEGCPEQKGMSKDEKASKSKVSRRSLTCGRCNIRPVYPNPYSPRWVGGTTSSKYVLYSRLEHYCHQNYAAPCLSYVAP